MASMDMVKSLVDLQSFTQGLNKTMAMTGVILPQIILEYIKQQTGGLINVGGNLQPLFQGALNGFIETWRINIVNSG